ncbi:MAG: glycoside hydrolase family 2 protein, partial [Clostridia bacterium]
MTMKWNLNGEWLLSGGAFNNVRAVVPGCVHTDLLANGLMEDPFFRDNEEKTMWIGETDWTYTRDFLVSREILAKENISLVCHGLDTLAEIHV